MKKNYSSLSKALDDLKKDIDSTKDKRKVEVTNEYTRNTVMTPGIVPLKTGALKRDIVTKTNYKTGLVRTNLPYAAIVNEHNVTGVSKYLEHEWNRHSNYYIDFYKTGIANAIKV